MKYRVIIQEVRDNNSALGNTKMKRNIYSQTVEFLDVHELVKFVNKSTERPIMVDEAYREVTDK